MKKKDIIQIIIIAVCFGVAGLVLYNGFFKSNQSSSVAESAAVSPEQIQQVLPYGNSLNFAILHKFDQQYSPPAQPIQVSGEIGVPLQNLFAPLPSPPGQ